MVKLTSVVLFAASGLLAQAQLEGVGRIDVWNSSDWSKATPGDKVGCLSNEGRFINPNQDSDCGVFTYAKQYPYVVSTSAGNCTWADASQEHNTDSKYGKGDNALVCKRVATDANDGFYTIGGLSFPFMCFGDVACYYDAKRVPAKGQSTSLWQYHWGSEQIGITPGHIQLQLVWNKIRDSRKRDVQRLPEGKMSLMGPKRL